MNQYLVVTADMINSRNVSIEQIATIPNHLQLLDDHLDSLIPSALFAGDEIQMLFPCDEKHHPYRLLPDLIRYLYPFQFRIGFGIGAADQPVNQSMAQNKGPVFMHARNALTIAKKERLTAWLSTENDGPLPEINSCFLLFTAITVKWTPKHWRRFFLYWDKRSIYKVAEIENVSPESINKFLKNASIRTIIKSLDIYPDIKIIDVTSKG